MDLLNILPPAIAITVLAYLAKFFGKIISDQKPFADERGWEIELNGLFFMLGLVSSGAIGIALALYWPFVQNSWWWHLTILFLVSVIAGLLYLVNSALSSRAYGIKLPFYEKLLLDLKLSSESLIKIGNFIPIWLVQMIMPYLVVKEYMAHNILWFITVLCQAFLALMFLAFNFSLRRLKLPKVDIYFVNNQAPLTGVTLLKVNADNIRLRDQDKIVILNKDLVAKIEMDIKQS